MSTDNFKPILDLEKAQQSRDSMEPTSVQRNREAQERKRAGRAPKTFVQNNRHRIVAYMSANGASPKQIEKFTGYTQQNVSKILTRLPVKKEVLRIQRELFGSDATKIFKTLAPNALAVALGIMNDEKEKGGTRHAVSRDFLDRAYGKPVQRIQSQSKSMIGVLIGRLDMNSNEYGKDEKIVGESAAEHAFENRPEDCGEDFGDWIEQNL